MKVAIVTFPGSNCDRDCEKALAIMGVKAELVRSTERSLAGFDAVVLPGGFSFGDAGRPGLHAQQAPIIEALGEHIKRGAGVLGICNGFQILTESGHLPGSFERNTSGRFICRIERVRCERSGDSLDLPIAHGYGRFQIEDDGLSRLEESGGIWFRYESNPNGSAGSIAGIRQGRVLGLMPHPERAVDAEIGGSEDGRRVFEAMLS